ncbi:MAG TPA: hypothetical protein PKI76_03255 [Oscillospiraceae bacterium]|nr:hypothetical protein [Oscillospiraceae bacterium]HNW04384.1 hypothetical protein [Oscillospiraceae bacterium]
MEKSSRMSSSPFRRPRRGKAAGFCKMSLVFSTVSQNFVHLLAHFWKKGYTE